MRARPNPPSDRPEHGQSLSAPESCASCWAGLFATAEHHLAPLGRVHERPSPEVEVDARSARRTLVRTTMTSGTTIAAVESQTQAAGTHGPRPVRTGPPTRFSTPPSKQAMVDADARRDFPLFATHQPRALCLVQPPMPVCALARAALSSLAPPPSTCATDFLTALASVVLTVSVFARS